MLNKQKAKKTMTQRLAENIGKEIHKKAYDEIETELLELINYIIGKDGALVQAYHDIAAAKSLASRAGIDTAELKYVLNQLLEIDDKLQDFIDKI